MLNEAKATELFKEQLSPIHEAIFNFKIPSLKSISLIH